MDRAAPQEKRRWLWPPRLFTFAVIGCVLIVAFLANYPAVRASHPELGEGKYGHTFKLVPQYEHGWPWRYSTRDFTAALKAGSPLSPWKPWEGSVRWDTFNLLLNVALWTLILVLAAATAQWWRSQRRAIWQLGLRDLLAITAVLACGFAWFGYERHEYLKNQRFTAELELEPYGHYDSGVTVPAWLPPSLQLPYTRLFTRVAYFHSEAETDVASQYRHIIVLREIGIHPAFPKHLKQMPQLEAINLAFVPLPYFDATRRATVLRDLPRMPNLRGINLYGTNTTDADMAWLARCRRLEVVDLYDVEIGDEGIAHLQGLPRLRSLRLSSDRITDEGCRHLAEFPALEELWVASRSITDVGAGELTRLKGLKELRLSASASEGTLVELQKSMPDCEVTAKCY